MKSGIYCITNIVTGIKYIGSSKNIDRRFYEHQYFLEKNEHINVYLQRSFNKHGIDNFIFTILKDVEEPLLLIEEQIWIDSYPKAELYNLGVVGGGDNTSNHPDNAGIRVRISEGLKRAHAKRTPEELEERSRQQTGVLNNNYGIKWDDSQKEKMSKMMVDRMAGEDNTYRRLSSDHMQAWWDNISDDRLAEFKNRRREIMLTNNPFKGKTHSDDSKQKISERLKLRWVSLTPEERALQHPYSRKVSVDNIEYFSLSEGARQTGISPALMVYRLKSSSPKWASYQYIT